MQQRTKNRQQQQQQQNLFGRFLIVTYFET